MKTFIYTLLFASFTLLYSCIGGDESNYNGKWSLVTKPLLDKNYYWHFTDGRVAIYTEDTLSLEVDTCSTGDYYVKNNAITIAAPVTFCEWSVYDGEWDVLRHTDKFLTLIRYLPRGTVYLEFAKR